MADGLRRGWEFDNKNDNTNVVRATLPARLLPSAGTGIGGANQPILTKANLSNGNYDVYVPGGPLQGDRIIYSRNASDNKLIVQDQTLFNAYFNQNNQQGKTQFENLDSNIKLATYDNAQLLTGTDPIRNQNFEKIKNTPTYKSLSNSTPPGQRAPGATGGTVEPTPAPATAGGAGNEDLKLTEAENNFEIETKGVRTDYGNMIYPLDLSSQNEKQDVVKFTMISYGRKKIEGLRLTAREFNKDKQINGSVVLAIQPRISDNNTVRWNEQNMDVLSIGLAGAALNTIEGGFAGTKESISQIGKAFQEEGSNVTGALKTYFAQEAAKTQNNLLSRLQGGILNPNLELLFESPDLRTFNYSFQLSPREPKEAQEVRKIIRFFKQGMAVQRSVAELFLKAPNVFEIKYLLSGSQGKDHPYLNRIKKCALVSCGVDYTPTGSYMTFAGSENSMVSYGLTLTFREIEPIYADDYNSTTDFKQIKNIGF
jgi:hypothetical protein